MAKTIFSSGVIVTSAWLNGARHIVFDGQDLDWHYNPLGLESLVTRGPSGLDSRYITQNTEQPVLSTTGILLTGKPLSGNKVISGAWKFGLDPTLNPGESQNPANAPRSFLTNLKYDAANGVSNPSITVKFQALTDADLVTKKVLRDQLKGLVIDNGEY